MPLLAAIRSVPVVAVRDARLDKWVYQPVAAFVAAATTIVPAPWPFVGGETRRCGGVMIWVGTSGWQYDSWRERLYAGVPRKGWLEHYAGRFATVEVNNAFYRLPSREVFESWRGRTPGGFVVAVKMS